MTSKDSLQCWIEELIYENKNGSFKWLWAYHKEENEEGGEIKTWSDSRKIMENCVSQFMRISKILCKE